MEGKDASLDLAVFDIIKANIIEWTAYQGRLKRKKVKKRALSQCSGACLPLF